MLKPKEDRIAKDFNERTQFAHAGVEYATYGNMDQDEIFVVDPDTLEYIGKPQEDVEYPMLRMGINNVSCKFYENATVTKRVDDLMREHTGMTGTRDWYDVTMLVRVSDKPENLESLTARRAQKGFAKRAPTEECDGNVVQLFPSAPE